MLVFAAETNSLFALFDNNLINWIVLVVLLVILWNRMMPAVFAKREQTINAALEEARRAREEGQEFLKKQEERVANAEKEAEQILVEAKKVAEQMRAQTIEDTKKDAEEMMRKTKQQIEAEVQMAKAELRSQAAIAALRMAEAALPGAITSGTKQKLHSDFIGQLDSVGNH